MAFWHGRILPATFYFRRRGIVVITSENFDGEWIARIIERFGYGTARGSTSRGGAEGDAAAVRDMEAGKPAGFTLDGPRGPARVAQPGAVWLARATGNPVLPFHLEASSPWTLRSWDRTQIPKPFSTVALAIGEPMEVARGRADGAAGAARVEIWSGGWRALEERGAKTCSDRDGGIYESSTRTRPAIDVYGHLHAVRVVVVPVRRIPARAFAGAARSPLNEATPAATAATTAPRRRRSSASRLRGIGRVLTP